MERKRKPPILPQFIFNKDVSIIEKYELDNLKGQGSIVLSVLQHAPMPTDSRNIAEIVEKHPEFKTKITIDKTPGFYPAARVTNWWLSYFRKIGLLVYTDENEQRRFEQRSKGKAKSYYRNKHTF